MIYSLSSKNIAAKIIRDRIILTITSESTSNQNGLVRVEQV
jgi:hypothetical protein